ncbi:MAG: nucleoside-diphosphate sugar epimerase/dehydratase [Proteobacteria bacterium]|nr:nucleoside-diphosphate sugar epimerase/dehydratase [Pseudomonadota bacterium]
MTASTTPRPFISLSRVSLVALHDLIQATIAFELAVWVRHQTLGNDQPFFFAWPNTLIFVAICAVVFWRVGLYRGIWHYASVTDLVTIVKGVTLGALIFLPALFLITRLQDFPRTSLLLVWPLLVIQLSLPRLAYRLLKDGNLSAVFERAHDDRVPVLLVGAGSTAEVFIREMSRPGAPYNVVGIIDDKPGRIGRDIRGVRVMDIVDRIPEAVARLDAKGLRPQRLLLATEKITADGLRALLTRADGLGMTLARLPRLTDFHGGQGGPAGPAIRPLAMEDLLGRPQKVLDRDSMRRLIAGRRVMVTGAGGTIGSELVRQIALLAPTHITLLDNGEHALYQIDMELATAHSGLSRSAVLADVRDDARVAHVFAGERPELVFHAAAFKHVPLSEQNPHEAVLTNVIGSRNIARACLRHDVDTMVLISTDKAVNPTSVMGVSKRLAEMYCQALGREGEAAQTRFVAVRFGNVLGSTGSVVPLFQKQIAAGGPVTVTDPATTRFFMTTREAVELVLQASAMDASQHVPGTVFVLDMGEPVKIVDLARQMIRLVGLQPDKDIAIRFTGMRPGEKLHEELSHEAEDLTPTAQDGILRAAPRTMSLSDIDHTFDMLCDAARREDLGSVLELIREAVPEFTPRDFDQPSAAQ